MQHYLSIAKNNNPENVELQIVLKIYNNNNKLKYLGTVKPLNNDYLSTMASLMSSVSILIEEFKEQPMNNNHL